VHNLSATAKPKVGIFSSLEIDERVDPGSYQSQPAWVFLSQLRERFEVEMLEDLNIDTIRETSLLIVIHPKNLSDAQLFAIDQHVMGGGKLLAFVDPISELDQPATPGMSMPGASASELNRLTKGWGVSLREGEVLGDAEAALMVGGADGTPVRHLGILGLTGRHLSREDVVTASLESLNLATAGIFDVDDIDGVTAIPLLVSSEHAGSFPAMQFSFLSDPAELQKGFMPTGESYVSAVRLSGVASSAFPDGVEDLNEEVLLETRELQVVLVADTDVLSDRLWVQVQNFFGQQIASAFADNGTFVNNLVDNLLGSSALIDVRSRGQFTRPFTVVQDLRLTAEAKYLQSAEDLQGQLAETERQLSELESAGIEDGLFTLSPEQEAALARFQDEKLKIRKQLRDVRHQLDKDIEQLGTMLKFLNILLMPLLLTGGLLVIRLLGLGRRSGDTA
jgi:ABC-type uncharacterized transport system involved in gliding motility auxiliary subunit